MTKLRRFKATSGFTLVETTIVVAIIGGITVMLIGGAFNASRTERFRSEVAIFASRIREAKTHSYTIQTGESVGSCQRSVPPYDPGSKGCIWRGVLMHYQINNPYTQSLLYGDDFSSFGNLVSNISSPCIPNDPRECIRGSLNPINYNQSTSGLIMESIKTDTSPAFSSPTSINTVDVAFLAPTGVAYATCGISPCSALRPYDDDTHLIRFHFKDDGVKLTADVTFDPASGTINTSIQ